ncbi:MAG: mannitol dehydrogenase family protein, partial [Pseudomonadota bacterium]
SWGHNDPMIASELSGGEGRTIYAYLRHSLRQRWMETGTPLTIACCDNIRQNGKMLAWNLRSYLQACGDHDLLDWVTAHVAFPCSMVDRITPRSPDHLGAEISALVGQTVTSPIMAEDFIQWVLEDTAAAPMPDLAKAGVIVTPDVDPYEETKIRVLNGGHTVLAYMAALNGLDTFDQAMADPALRAHFDAFERDEVLPAITIDLPFAKKPYVDQIARRFGNRAIGDTVARICADGMAKFPIFVRPTLEGCLKQGIMPIHAIRSIASWHRFAEHVAAGQIPFDYVEPGWAQLQTLLGTDAFLHSSQLWGDIPETYPEFVATLREEISETELKWPV